MLEFDAGNFASSQINYAKKGLNLALLGYRSTQSSTVMEIPSRSGEGELQSQGKGGASKVTSKELPSGL